MKIALYGKMGSGKSTIAKHLHQKHQMVILSFATEIKFLARRLFGGVTDGPQKDRVLLQKLGASMRAIDDDVWTKFLIRNIKHLETYSTNIVVDDLRLPEEADALRKEGFFIIHIDTADELRAKRVEIINPHDRTETAMDSYDKFDATISITEVNEADTLDLVDAAIDHLAR